MEDWENIKGIFEAATQIAPAKRADFLKNACGEDLELRRQIEQLLDSHENANSFMKNPAVGALASQIITDQKPAEGQRIDQYEIISQIGAGGMGEVYLAEDTTLKRRVGLKLLAAHISADAGRVSRFRQEALATSALNHPNIITIYQIGQWQGRDFIATEFVDGITLRTLLGRPKKISAGETLDIILQIADGLAAAHAAGIVHRDIKPENIMIRTDGLIKILDFGIAKYSPTADRRKALVETAVGEVIGTAAYMSPEQARGLEIDARTDIWSLGVILYEIIAGHLPFPGRTRSDRIAAILEHDPLPATPNRKLPAGLKEVAARALAKDKANRYQEIAEMAADLHKIGEQTGIERRAVRRVSAKRQNFAWPYAIFAVIILLLAGGAVWFYITGTSDLFARKPALNLQSMKIERLSNTGQAIEVAVSPDGEFVAFIKEENSVQSLWLRQISAPSSVEIVPPAENMRFGSPAFSSDGGFVYYLKAESLNARADLYQIPKLGGQEKKLVADISLQDSGSSFSISTDGRSVAFIRLDDSVNRSLVITDLDGGNERRLISRKSSDSLFLTGAAFSPDGQTVATIDGKFGGRQRIILVATADGTQIPLSDKEWAGVQGLTWLDDGSGLIIAAAERVGLIQLWHISAADGEISRVTNDLNDYTVPSLTSRSAALAVVQVNQRSHIWITTPTGQTAKQITDGNGGKDGEFGLAVAPDGSVVYVSQVSGTPEIWSVSADGSSTKQLTEGAGVKRFPAVSPDGKYIVFLKTDENAIWRMDSDGTNPKLLTTGSIPTFSPDGDWVYFYRGGSLWKIAAGGGEPIRIPTRERDLATAPVVSPDNTLIACNYLVAEPNAQFRIGILPIEGGDPLKILDTNTYAISPLHWLPGGRAVSFIDTREGVSNIFSQMLESGNTAPVTKFDSGTIWNFDWSADGQILALARGETTRDVVLIRDFR